MALIYFYDATELDKQQLSSALSGTDHRWEYVDDKIGIGNLDPAAEVISVFVTSEVTREIIDALPNLRLIACRSTGFNTVDLEAATERGIAVVNVPTYGDATVAEYAFTMLLALQRKLQRVFQAENEQFSQTDLRGHDLNGKVFGVIGTGHIGQRALQIARGFSMQTLAYDTRQDSRLAEELGFRYVDLETVLSEADIVSLHVPYVPDTHHLIDAERLALMKPSAIVINTARGELVDTAALIEALDAGRLGGAAIDVVEGEQLLHHDEETALLRSHVLPESALRHSVELSVLKKMPNVIISPHNAFNTIEAIERINRTTAQNIIDFWSGAVPNRVAAPQPKYGKLLISRHAESEWNATGQWSGVTDVHLSEKGFRESAQLGQALKQLDIKIDVAYCSEQIRTRETMSGMLNAAQQFEVDIQTNPAINERDYGEYTGKNKWEMKKLLGETAFNDIRRGWNVPIPGGETLRDVYERVLPFYQKEVVPQLQKGKNVLIVAHGNSIRSLMKYLESISDDDIAKLEMLFGEIVVYDIDSDGRCKARSAVSIDTTPPPA